MDAPGGGPVPGVRGRAQRDELARDLVGRDGDDAVAAHREHRQGPGVVAGQDRDVARPVAADPGDLLEVAAGLLDRDDPRVLGESQERVRIDVRAGPRRDVVDDDRQVALVGDGPEVRVEHPAVGPVVVGGDDERGVGAELGRPAGRTDRGGGVVRAGPGDDRDAIARRALGGDLHGRGDEPLALLGRQGGGLAGRAARDEAVDAGQDLPAHEPAECGLVEGAVRLERRDEGGQRAANLRAGGHGRPGGAGLAGGGHRSVLSGSDGAASDELVDDGVEGVDAGSRGARVSQSPAARIPAA